MILNGDKLKAFLPKTRQSCSHHFNIVLKVIDKAIIQEKEIKSSIGKEEIRLYLQMTKYYIRYCIDYNTPQIDLQIKYKSYQNSNCLSFLWRRSEMES